MSSITAAISPINPDEEAFDTAPLLIKKTKVS
jgi:hypothetical protein